MPPKLRAEIPVCRSGINLWNIAERGIISSGRISLYWRPKPSLFHGITVIIVGRDELVCLNKSSEVQFEKSEKFNRLLAHILESPSILSALGTSESSIQLSVGMHQRFRLLAVSQSIPLNLLMLSPCDTASLIQ